MLKAQIKGVIESLKNMQYLRYYFLKPKIQRNQIITKEGYDRSWGRDLKKLKEIYHMPRLMVIDNKFTITTTLELDSHFIRTHYNGIKSITENNPNISKILEVGAGYGRTLYPLASLFPGIVFTGIEYSSTGPITAKKFTETCAEEIKGVASAVANYSSYNVDNLTTGDGKALPYEDKTFDISYTNLVLEQVPGSNDHEQIIKEMKRVSRKACCFLEPWAEAQDLITMAYLKGIDYFSAKTDILHRLGFHKVTNVPLKFHHNLKYKLSYVIAEL